MPEVSRSLRIRSGSRCSGSRRESRGNRRPPIRTYAERSRRGVENCPWMGARAERMEARLEVPMLVAAALVIPGLILEVSHVGATGKAIALALKLGNVARVRGRAGGDARGVRSRRVYLAHNPLRMITVLLHATVSARAAPELPAAAPGAALAPAAARADLPPCRHAGGVQVRDRVHGTRRVDRRRCVRQPPNRARTTSTGSIGRSRL